MSPREYKTAGVVVVCNPAGLFGLAKTLVSSPMIAATVSSNYFIGHRRSPNTLPSQSLGDTEPSAACSAPLPAHQLSPLQQDVDDEEIPPCAPVQCSGAWSSSYSGDMELSAACSERSSVPLPFQHLSQDSPAQDVDDEEIFLQLRAPVQCSEDLSSDEQFLESSIEEENFDKAKSELVCSNSNG